MSGLFAEKEPGAGELALLAEEILLELKGSEKSESWGFEGGVYGEDAARAEGGFAAEHGARRAFEALGTEAGRAVFREPERGLLSNTARLAKDAEETERRSAVWAGEYGESGAFDSPLLKTGGGSAGGRGPSAGADREEDGRRSAAGEQGLGGSGLPERLSEIFCRDARRYDGPFDRY